MTPRALVVVIHDVAPARWAGCRRVIDTARAVAASAGAALPLSWLVVPRWHGQADWPPALIEALRTAAAAGDELLLHGFDHLDGQPLGRGATPFSGLPERWRRRVLTAGEGEFAALSAEQARHRIGRARCWAVRHGLPVAGFVPPAWLASAGARQAIAGAGFGHTCSHTRLVAMSALAESRSLFAPALTFSTRSAVRRALSCGVVGALARVLRDAPLLRLELHPDDADHAAVRRCWTGVLEQALATRTPLTLGQAAARIGRAAVPDDDGGAGLQPRQASHAPPAAAASRARP